MMDITPEILKFAGGEEFSNSLEFDLGNARHKALSREEAIVNIIRNGNVIHIGCSDHIPLIREKIKNNRWLHKLITENSNSCLGIDNDKESIDFLINELGYKNVKQGDIISDDIPEISSKQWDYAVFGEVIEHLGDPVNFLSTFRTKYGKNVDRFLISVPTIYNRFNLKEMLRYREVVNSDHRFWFTPYTLIKVAASAGLRPEKIEFVNTVKLSFIELVIRKIRKFAGLPVNYPFYFFKTIIVTGSFS